MLLRFFIILLLAAGVFGGAYYGVHRLYLEPQEKLQADKRLPPPTPPPDPSLEEFARLEELRKVEPPPAAKAAFERFLKEYPDTKKRDAALDVIGEINSELFFATKPNESNVYVVKPGDSLSRVAARTKVSMEQLVQLNKLSRDILHPGQKLLAPASDFRVILRQKQRRIVLMNGDQFFRQYPAISWPGANKVPQVFLPKQTGKVIKKAAIGERGTTVKTTDLNYVNAAHILTLSIPGHSIYTQPPEGAIGPRPDGGGITLSPAHAAEIAVLIPDGAPVTME